MYESMTHDYLLEDAKTYAGTGVQKGEGSLVYNALSALAYELEKLYIQADYILNQYFADTADYEHLVSIAANRGIYPISATAASVAVTADAELPIGWRGSLKGYNYFISSVIDSENYQYVATCEETGTGPNELTGKLIPIDYVDGLTSAVITSVLVAGRDQETQEELYTRYLESFNTEPFGGNIADYKQKVNAFDGIGGCKVYPTWNGVGTVKIVVIGSDYGEVSDYLVAQIQEAAVPTQEGSGYGFATIEHDVTIASVEEVTVNISTSLTYTSGYDWDDVSTQVNAVINTYLTGIAQAWADGTEDTMPIVYVSRIEAAILSVTGIEDVTGTTLNGSASNLQLDSDQIPVKGTVTVS